MTYYRRPGWFTKRIFNGVVAGATRAGISVWGSRVLRVKAGPADNGVLCR